MDHIIFHNMHAYFCLSVEVPEDVSPAKPVGNISPEFICSLSSADVIGEVLSAGSITERSVSRELALANLVMSTFRDIEVDRSVSGNKLVAKTVTPGGGLRNTAGTEQVYLTSLQVLCIRPITLN